MTTRSPAEDASLLEHLETVRRWCLHRCRDEHLAEDVAQDTLLAALGRIGELRDPTRLKAWLFRIAHCRLVDATRRRPHVLPLTAEPPAPPPGDSNVPDRIRRLRSALRRLPVKLRRPVQLHYLRGRPIREIAVTLDTTVNGVKARLYRARQLLRERTGP